MRGLFVFGRLIFGGFFAYNGINHFVRQKSMSQYAGAKGVPAAESAVPATGAMLIAGGASIMAGLKPRQGLAAVIGFLIPVTLRALLKRCHHSFESRSVNGSPVHAPTSYSRNAGLMMTVSP